jgi:hypothetical protein
MVIPEKKLRVITHKNWILSGPFIPWWREAIFHSPLKNSGMSDFLKVGEEVTFRGLLDIKLIVEGMNEVRGNVRCKYYDDHLKRFIKLTLPAESLVRSAVVRKKMLTPIIVKVA